MATWAQLRASEVTKPCFVFFLLIPNARPKYLFLDALHSKESPYAIPFPPSNSPLFEDVFTRIFLLFHLFAPNLKLVGLGFFVSLLFFLTVNSYHVIFN